MMKQRVINLENLYLYRYPLVEKNNFYYVHTQNTRFLLFRHLGKTLTQSGRCPLRRVY